MMKLLLTVLLLSSVQFSTQANAQDLCVDSQSKAQAMKTLQDVKTLAEQNGFAAIISSSGYETCNPTLFLASLAPGEFVHSHVAYPDVCGAVFTFSDPANMQSFIIKVKAANLSYDLSSRICVVPNLVQHR